MPVIDFYDDLGEAYILACGGEVAGHLKQAEFREAVELTDRDVALVLVDSGDTEYCKFACHDPSNTAMSMFYLANVTHGISPMAVKIAASNLAEAALDHGMEVPEDIEALRNIDVSSTMDRYIDERRVTHKEADVRMYKEAVGFGKTVGNVVGRASTWASRKMPTMLQPASRTKRLATEAADSATAKASLSKFQQEAAAKGRDVALAGQQASRAKAMKMPMNATPSLMDRAKSMGSRVSGAAQDAWTGTTTGQKAGLGAAAALGAGGAATGAGLGAAGLGAGALALSRRRQQNKYGQAPMSQASVGSAPKGGLAKPVKAMAPTTGGTAATSTSTLPKVASVYDHIKEASGFWDDLNPYTRRSLSLSLAEDAQLACTEVPPHIAKYAGSPDLDHFARAMIHRQEQVSDEAAQKAYGDLSKVAGILPPSEVVDLVYAIDDGVGLIHKYGSRLPDPVLAVYAPLEKEATYSWYHGNDNVNEGQLKRFASTHNAKYQMERILEFELAKKFRANPIKTFKGLPTPLKIVVSKMARQDTIHSDGGTW